MFARTKKHPANCIDPAHQITGGQNTKHRLHTLSDFFSRSHYRNVPTMAALSSSNWRARATAALPLKALPAAESVLSRQARWPEKERQYRDKQRQFRRQYEEGQDVNRVASEATRIYVGNMPYIASKSDIEKLFDETEFEV